MSNMVSIVPKMCNKCELGSHGMHQMMVTKGNCERCGKEVHSGSSFLDKLCNRCAVISHVCVHCGKPLEEET